MVNRFLPLILLFASCNTFAGSALSDRNKDDFRQPNARDLIQVADFAASAISPDGKYVVVRVDRSDVSRNAVESSWYVIDLSSGVARSLASAGNPGSLAGGETDLRAAVWSADSKSFYYLELQGEDLALWNSGLDGSVTKITNEDANIERFTLDKDSRKVIFEVGLSRAAIKRAEEKEYREGIVIDSTIMLGAPLMGSFSFRGRVAPLRFDFASGVYSQALKRAPKAYRVLDLKSGLTRAASPAEIEELPSNDPRPDKDNNSVVYSDRTGAIAFLFRDAEKGQESAIPAAAKLKWSPNSSMKDAATCNHVLCSGIVGRVAWRPTSNEVLFMSQSSAYAGSLRAWNTRTGVVRSIVSTDGVLGGMAGHGRYSSQMCPLTQRFAICSIARAAEPPRLVSIDLDTGEIRTIFDPNALVRGYAFGQIEHLEWRDRWGREINGVLVLPSGVGVGERLPLVITSYACGGFLRGGSGSNVPEHVLASVGIAALCVNASVQNTDSPYPADNVPPGQATHLQAVLDSWESGADLLISRGVVDPARVGISGLSFGGEAVHYALIHSDRFAAAASSHVTFTDPFAYYFFTGKNGAEIHRIYGLPPPNDDQKGVYPWISPALNVKKITAPLLIQTAEAELRTGVQYWHELTENRRPAELIVFPQEGHQFKQPANRLVMNDRFVDWFRYWLQGYVDASYAKAPQYERWRELRIKRDDIVRSERGLTMNGGGAPDR